MASRQKYEAVWTKGTFVDSFKAQAGLFGDRSGFISHKHIAELIPNRISALILHPDIAVQAKGFEDLFTYLDYNTDSFALRQLIVVYFYDNPALRPHLSLSFTTLIARYGVFLVSRYLAIASLGDCEPPVTNDRLDPFRNSLPSASAPLDSYMDVGSDCGPPASSNVGAHTILPPADPQRYILHLSSRGANI